MRHSVKIVVHAQNSSESLTMRLSTEVSTNSLAMAIVRALQQAPSLALSRLSAE